jgi:hypothetical protein
MGMAEHTATDSLCPAGDDTEAHPSQTPGARDYSWVSHILVSLLACLFPLMWFHRHRSLDELSNGESNIVTVISDCYVERYGA